MAWIREADGVRCTDHDVRWAHGAVMPCQQCIPDAESPVIDDPGAEAADAQDAEEQPDTRAHERWCNTLSVEAHENSRTLKTTETVFGKQPSACGPAWARVALSARIAAMEQADKRERRQWVREIHRLRAIAAQGGTGHPELPVGRPAVGVLEVH